MHVLKTASTAMLALTMISASSAQNFEGASVSFQSGNQRSTWQTVMLISAIVGIVGVAQGDSTLTILGGAGVLLSLYQTERMRFQLQPFQGGVSMLRSGPVTFGMKPFGDLSPAQGMTGSRPSVFVQATFKF